MKVKVRKVSVCSSAWAGLKLYLAARQLRYLPALRLAREACSEEERNFFAYIADMNLQRVQREVPLRETPEMDAFVLWMAGKMPGEEFEQMMLKSGKEDWLYHPSLQGEECPSNGKHKGVECRCDNCDTFLFCFPDNQGPN